MEDVTKDKKISTHKTVITWNEEKKEFLCSSDRQAIKVVESLRYKKHDDAWTPEELFVASIEGFVRDAFVDYAKKNSFEFLSYDSEAKGIIERVDDRLMFTEIKIWPQILIASSQNLEKAKELIEFVGKSYFVPCFLKCKVNIYPEIKIRT